MLQKVRMCLSVLLLLVAIFCDAKEAPVSTFSQLEAIDAELESLDEELHKARLKSMQAEINGQQLMFEEWSKYAQQIKAAEQFEEQANDIQERIDALKAKRAEMQEEKALLPASS